MGEVEATRWADLKAMFGAMIESEDVSQAVCRNCRETGHPTHSCPHPRVCYNCRMSGHEAYQCVLNPVPGSASYVDGVVCATCGEKGHTAKRCKSEGGAMYMRPGALSVKCHTFNRPLVIRVREDAGPSLEELTRAREDVISSLPKSDSNVKYRQMRDVELFQTALPLLKDPLLKPAEALKLRGGLNVLRRVVTGSLTLGVGGAAGRPSAQTHSAFVAEDAQATEQAAMRELRASGLDFHVVFGGRVEQYKRLTTEDPEAAEAARAQVQSHQYCPAGGRIPHAHELVASFPYLPERERFRRSEATRDAERAAAEVQRKRRLRMCPTGENDKKKPGDADKSSPTKQTGVEILAGALCGDPCDAPTTVERALDLRKSSQGAAGQIKPAAPDATTRRQVSARLLRVWSAQHRPSADAHQLDTTSIRTSFPSRIPATARPKRSTEEWCTSAATAEQEDEGVVLEDDELKLMPIPLVPLHDVTAPPVPPTFVTQADGGDIPIPHPPSSAGASRSVESDRGAAPISNWHVYRALQWHPSASAHTSNTLGAQDSDDDTAAPQTARLPRKHDPVAARVDPRIHHPNGVEKTSGLLVAEALAASWRPRFDSSKMQKHTEAVELLAQREAFRRRVCGSFAQLASATRDALSKGRQWSISHGVSKPSCSPRRQQQQEGSTLGGRRDCTTASTRSPRGASIWHANCRAMAERQATHQQRATIYRELCKFLHAIHGPHTLEGHAMVSDFVSQLSDESQPLAPSVLHDVLARTCPNGVPSTAEGRKVSVTMRRLLAHAEGKLDD